MKTESPFLDKTALNHDEEIRVRRSIVTATTVGYGDVSPVTHEGRLIAVALMIVGIGFIGLLTATITSFFMQPEQQHERNVEERLAHIEAQLQQLLERKGAE